VMEEIMDDRLADNATLEAVAERCIREAGDDLACAYLFADKFIEGRRNQIWVRREVYNRFVDATMERIGDAHPFKGKPKFYRCITLQGETLYNIGIDSAGYLSNPHNYPEDKVRNALRWAGAEAEVRKKEGAIHAVETRARRRSKLIHEIAAGILAKRKYGPRSFCCICQKILSDPQSIERGIGPECWDQILVLIEHQKDREARVASA